MRASNGPRGIGGWLIFVGIGVVANPFLLMRELVPLYYGAFSDGTFNYLTTPGTAGFHALWGPIFIFEVVFNVLTILVCFYSIYLFISKHYLFPRIYIALVLASVVFIPLDAWLVSLILTDEPMFDSETSREFARSLFTLMVWVPYMIFSKRVRATFVENRPDKPVRQRTVVEPDTSEPDTPV